jgi:hypothetical protein
VADLTIIARIKAGHPSLKVEFNSSLQNENVENHFLLIHTVSTNILDSLGKSSKITNDDFENCKRIRCHGKYLYNFDRS